MSLKITVTPQFEEARSKPEANFYLYSYTVDIKNEGNEALQILARHWRIVDAFQKVEHVVGEGVVGEEPIIEPGENFEYTSMCPLATSTGSMEGSLLVRSKDNSTSWETKIEQFWLLNSKLVN